MTSEPLIFYDIESAAPLRTFAPNPWKIRYALNHKRVPYKTSWTAMPCIPSVCAELGIKASRTHPNGEPYYTLPALNNHGKAIGDSFEIACHLDEAYPEKPLFLKGTKGLTAAFNAQVDALFTHYVCLCVNMPFPPSQLQEIISIFVSRASPENTAAQVTSPEDKEALLLAFEKDLSKLSKAYAHSGGTTDHILHSAGTASEQAQASQREIIGPFLDGDEPVYADFIVGAWLAMFAECLPEEDWKRVRDWQGGLWKSVHEALAGLRVFP